MLLALSGITGVGKSFYAEEIAKKLDFNKVHTIRTRTMRTVSYTHLDVYKRQI